MEKFITITLSLLFISCFGTKGLDVKKVQGGLSTSIESNIIDHSEWNALLKDHVDEQGFVNYKGFKRDKKKLDNYLDMLAGNPPQADWPVEEQLAYYINLYNAATIQLVTENYPVESIKDIGGIQGPFLISFIKVGEKEMSLANLERGILQQMNEPRIHFAINCASYSCPKLLNEAFTAKNLATLIDKATRGFINGDKNKLDEDNPELSKIFDWYESDFTSDDRTLVEYINQYAKVSISPNAQISYLPYDWSLNDMK